MDGPICLALIDADASCQREVARRLFGELRILNGLEDRTDSHLRGVDVVAIYGDTVDLAFVEHCLSVGKKVFLSATAFGPETIEPWLAKRWKTAEYSLTIGNPIASLPSRQCIYQQFVQGKLGDVGLIRIHRWGCDSALPNGESFSLPRSLRYELDQVLRYCDRPPQRLYATPYPKDRGMMLHLVWKDGAMVQIDYIRQLPNEQTYASFSVIGSRGAAYGDDHPNAQLLIGEQAFARIDAEVTSPAAHMLLSYLTERKSSSFASTRAASQSNAGQTEQRSTLWSWYQSEVLVRKTRESIEQHKCVELPCEQ